MSVRPKNSKGPICVEVLMTYCKTLNIIILFKIKFFCLCITMDLEINVFLKIDPNLYILVELTQRMILEERSCTGHVLVDIQN